ARNENTAPTEGRNAQTQWLLTGLHVLPRLRKRTSTSPMVTISAPTRCTRGGRSGYADTGRVTAVVKRRCLRRTRATGANGARGLATVLDGFEAAPVRGRYAWCLGQCREQCRKRCVGAVLRGRNG